jgi:hypothetical protein
MLNLVKIFEEVEKVELHHLDNDAEKHPRYQEYLESVPLYKNLKNINPKIEYKQFNNEISMIEYFLKNIVAKVPILAGWNSDNFEISLSNGYYGEEVEDAILIESVAVKIENQLGEAFNINELSRRIEYLLKLEYGYLLDTLKGKNYEFITIDKSDILFGSKSQYRKVKNMDLSYYKSYKSFRGIVIEQNNKYQLIDGYHRCLSSDGKIKVIKAV